MSEIKVEKLEKDDDKSRFRVTVEDNNTSIHEVTLNNEFYRSLNTKTSQAEIIRKSFEFLLKREPKEAILSEFDLRLISKYFPEFEDEVKQF